MDRLILFVATLGPIGRKLPAPGTFGSLAGLLVFWLLIYLIICAYSRVIKTQIKVNIDEIKSVGVFASCK